MGDLVKRDTAEVIANTAGATIGPIVTSLMATAAVVTQNPELGTLSIPAGALAGAVTEKGVQLVARTLLDPFDRVRRLVDAIGDESGEDAEALIFNHVTEAPQRELLGHTVEAATHARSDWKIRLLARAFVQGIKDGDRIDETEMFVKATRHLEPAHARILAAAIHVMSDGGRIYVTTESVREHDEKIGRAAAALWRELKTQGLIMDYDVDTNRTASGSSKTVILSARQINEGFRPTDLGYAVGEWLQALDPEPTDPESG